MARRKHLFYFVDAEGRTMVVNNGIVTPSGARSFLNYAPIGSKDIKILWERDKDKGGLIRNFSTDLQFIRDGAKILRKTHYAENEERELYLLLQRLGENYEAAFFEEIYKTIYKGKLDFYTAEDGGTAFKISIAESSLTKKLAANEGTVYEHPLNDPEGVTIYNDGIKFSVKQNYIITESSPVNIGDDGLALVGVSETSREGTPAGIAFFTVFYDEAEPTNFATDTRYFLRASQSVEAIRITGGVKFFPQASGGTYVLYLQSSLGRTIDLINIPIATTQVKELSFDVSLNAAADEKFFLMHSRQGTNIKTVLYKETTLEVSVTSNYNPSYIDALPINVLNRRAVGKITGNERDAQSELLNLNDNLVITSGDGLRGIPGAVIKTSYKDIFTTAKVLLFAGLSVEHGRIKIESLERFFTTTNPVPLGGVKNFVVSEVPEFMFTEIKIGYPSQQLDEVNGKFSFHNTSVYGTPRKNADAKTFTLICPFIADPYAQEITRINLEGKTTTDNANDNKNYIIDSEAIPPTQFNAVVFTAEAGRYFFRLSDNPHLFPFVFKRVTMAFPLSNTTLNILSVTREGAELLVEVAEPVTPETRDVVVSFHVRRIRRPAGLVVAGVPNGERLYNVLLSPASIAQRWKRWLNSLFWNFQGQQLPFLSTEKNRGVSYTFNGSTVKEDAPVTIGPDRLFIPKYFNFTVPAPLNMAELFEENPNQGFTAIGRGVEVFGFADKAGLGLVDGKEQEFRLLCGPAVDLSRFV